MDPIDSLMEIVEGKTKTKTNSSKKRKWREIEQFKEKLALEKELHSYDNSLEYLLEES
ncbi:DUF3545 family protein [Thalassotalea mangrovi]|uniref:DUF3545 family protein n=1 Tax=Thalassotalea mangrovi TaxID=2572245 RepID=A0A4U1BB62_9GAMM|nr:DUF3545 family protein [Thalassotalea mangrovi]TKB47408.1 DUF3545 family protein [Thalassotalea mangrovi]